MNLQLLSTVYRTGKGLRALLSWRIVALRPCQKHCYYNKLRIWKQREPDSFLFTSTKVSVCPWCKAEHQIILPPTGLNTYPRMTANATTIWMSEGAFYDSPSEIPRCKRICLERLDKSALYRYSPAKVISGLLEVSPTRRKKNTKTVPMWKQQLVERRGAARTLRA